MTSADRHLTPGELATRWNISRRTLERWRGLGRGPAFIKVGGSVRYRLDDIEAYESNRLRRTEQTHAGRLGHVRTNAKVAENPHRLASGDGREAVTAAIFWLKTRAKWKETSVHELGGASDLPPLRIERIERVIIDPVEHDADHECLALQQGSALS